MSNEQNGSHRENDTNKEQEPPLGLRSLSVDEELAAAARELEQKLDPEAVSQASLEIREQLRREIRDRLAVAAKAKAARRRSALREMFKPEVGEFERFSLLFRIQHILLFSSCIVLIITGLPLKFPNTAWAYVFFKLMGGVAASGTIHRIGASGLIAVGIFHMLYITFTDDGRNNFKQLIPTPKDVTDVLRNVLYFLGLSKSGARFGRFGYIEKFDYWAVYWGMVVMITSGLMLWFQDQAMALLPKFAIDIAHEAHSDEALLATLAIIIWHFYNVHFNPDCFPMNWTWLTGKVTRERMIHHHPLEYERIMAEQERLAAAEESRPQAPRVEVDE